MSGKTVLERNLAGSKRTLAGQALDRLFAEHHELDMSDVAAELALRLRVSPLAHVVDVWDLSLTDVAGMFSVSRQAVAKWAATGSPPERAAHIADLAAASDLLVRHLKRDRIAAVVRRPAAGLGNRSLLDLAATGDTAAVLAACRAMFAFETAVA
jgi:hypothetical protein